MTEAYLDRTTMEDLEYSLHKSVEPCTLPTWSKRDKILRVIYKFRVSVHQGPYILPVFQGTISEVISNTLLIPGCRSVQGD